MLIHLYPRLTLAISLSIGLLSCAGWDLGTPGSPAKKEALENDALENKADALERTNYSQWYDDSLALCDTQAESVQAFRVPQIDLWTRVRSGFALPELSNPRIEQEIRWYTSHPNYLPRVSERAAPYLYHIVEELERRHMPLEFALLPIVESAYDPFAYSHGRAAGLWQVIPSTGKMLGLKQNWWYDGRRDVVASTSAALTYLEQLRKRFDGDWLLAVAAYNSGAGNVFKAIRRNKKEGKPTDFWSLKLPKETLAYVPRLLALKEVFNDPDTYKTHLFSVANAPYFEQVDVHSQIDLNQAATFANLSMKDFYMLNPGFNRWATDPDGPHTLLVPIEKADKFKQELAQLPADKRVVWQRYTVKQGDALSKIARQFNTSVEALRTSNNLKGSRIRIGQTLLVPPDASTALTLKHKAGAKGNKMIRRVTYQVRSGDSLARIADKFDVRVRDLVAWNKKVNTKKYIQPGDRLTLYVDVRNIDS